MIEDTIADNTFDFEQITALQEWEENIHSEVFDSYANRQRAQARANFQSLATDGEEIMKYFENYALNREDEIRSSGDEVIESGQMTMIVATRSEEHTSELQSRGHLVCRLLLEKKKYKISTPKIPKS